MEIPQILIEGPPGAGKTTFLQHLLLSNRSRRIAATRIGERGIPEELDRMGSAGAASTALVPRAPEDLGTVHTGPYHGVVHEADAWLNRYADLRVYVTRPIPDLMEPGGPREDPALDGLVCASSVVLNIRGLADRGNARRTEVGIRKFEARLREHGVERQGFRRLPKRRTIYIADLLDPRDPALKKALGNIRRRMPSSKESRRGVRHYWLLDLEITLLDVEPPVRRRVRTGGLMSFYELHLLIQSAMGWKNAHAHYFDTMDGRRFGIVPPDSMGAIAHSHLWSAGPFLCEVGDRLQYVYDLGDGWRHSVETVARQRCLTAEGYPICIDGEGRGPPEDVGGPHGFAHFKEVMSDPADEEHEEMRRWYGGDFDPAEFEPEEVEWRGP
jgi:hypothetical protein